MAAQRGAHFELFIAGRLARHARKSKMLRMA